MPPDGAENRTTRIDPADCRAKEGEDMGEPVAATPPELKPGMAVEVLTMGNELIFSGKVESYDGKMMSVRDTRGRELPVGVYGKPVKLRFERSESNLMVYGKICRSSAEAWTLDELEEQFVAPRRSFFRQRIDVAAEVTCTRRGPAEPELRRGVTWQPCRVTDVSAGGLQLSSKEPFQEGDMLSVRNARLVASGPAFTFSCRVRRSIVTEDGTTLCGCAIESMPARDQSQLEEVIFVLQREEIQRRRERGRG